MGRKWNRKKNKKKNRKPHPQKRTRAYRKALQIAGQTGNLVGKDGEQRVFKACRYGEFPSWWLGFRMATEAEDAFQETDHVAKTDVGDIPLQTKTSLHKKAGGTFRRSGKGVPIIDVWLADSDEEIRNQVIRIIAEERKKILEKRAKTSR